MNERLHKPWLLLDVGTTKLRAKVFHDGRIIASAIGTEGVSLTVREGKEAFCAALRFRCDEVLEACGLEWDALGGAAASGMITSGLGLLEIPHIPAPAGVMELAKAMQMSDGLPSPLLLCPGVRNAKLDDGYDVPIVDFMRGEETEALGLDITDGLFVSTGSHMKYVWLEDGRIQRCRTTMGGELLEALTGHTILASSLDGLAQEVQPEWVLRGMRACYTYGLTAAAFDVRKLQMFDVANAQERANYLAGAVMTQDVAAIEGQYDVIAVGQQMAQVFKLVWEALGKGSVRILQQEQAQHLAAYGLWRVVTAYFS